MNIINQMRTKSREREKSNALAVQWLGPVRMLVIAIIAFGYASTMPRGPSEAEYLRTFGYDPSWFGISILFMISGFLALRSLENHGSPIKFLQSRLGRNLPTLAVFALLVVLVAFPLLGVPLNGTSGGGSRLSQHVQYLFKVITCLNADQLTPGLLDNALYMCVIQGGLWTFRWGVIAYILTAILWTIGGLRDRRVLLIFTAAMITTYGALMFYGSITPERHALFELTSVGLRLGWVYLMGMCAYAYREKLPRTMTIPLTILALTSVQYYLLRWTPFIEISAEIGFGYLVFLGITSQKTMPAWLEALPDLSLGIYVFNWPTAQIMLLLVPDLTPLPLFALSFPLAVLIAFATWAIISRQINTHVAHVTAMA